VLSRAQRILLLVSMTIPLSVAGCVSSEEPGDEPNDAVIAPGEGSDTGGPESAAEGSDAQRETIDMVAVETVDSPDHPQQVAATLTEAPNQAPAVQPAGVSAASMNSVASSESESLMFKGRAKKLWVFVDRAAIKAAPNASAKVIGTLDYGQPIMTIGEHAGWVKLGEGQYIQRKYLTDRKSHFYWRNRRHVTAH